LKAANASQDEAAIDTAMAALNTAWQAASQDMYAATQDNGAAAQGEPNTEGSNDNKGAPVEDATYEEVK
jgi:molecular chaperone DnaK